MPNETEIAALHDAIDQAVAAVAAAHDDLRFVAEATFRLGGVDHFVETAADLEDITDPATRSVAFARDTERLWRFDGDAWEDLGDPPTAKKAVQASIEAKAAQAAAVAAKQAAEGASSSSTSAADRAAVAAADAEIWSGALRDVAAPATRLSDYHGATYQEVDDLGNIRREWGDEDVLLTGTSALLSNATGYGGGAGDDDTIITDGLGNIMHVVPAEGGGVTEYHMRDGDLVPVRANVRKAAIWGSSSTAGISPILSTQLANIGVELYQGGGSGELGDQTLFRMGPRPAEVTFPNNKIPAAAGAVSVTVTGTVTTRPDLLRSFTGVCQGVAGTLSYSIASTSYIFNRATAGAEVTLPGPVKCIPTEGLANRSNITLIWLGKNSLTNAVTAETVIEQTRLAASWLAPVYSRFMVLGHFVDAEIVASKAANILECNRQLAAIFGQHYVDVQAYLMSPQVWSDTGLTPSSADQTAQSGGYLPPSLRTDNAHLNNAAYAAIGARLLLPRMKTLWKIGQ